MQFFRHKRLRWWPMDHYRIPPLERLNLSPRFSPVHPRQTPVRSCGRAVGQTGKILEPCWRCAIRAFSPDGTIARVRQRWKTVRPWREASGQLVNAP